MSVYFNKSIAGPAAPDQPALSMSFAHAAQIPGQRKKLINQVFGTSTLPSNSGSLSSVTSPITLTGTSGCQKITFSGISAEPRVWTPSSANGDLFLTHGGHEMTFSDLNWDDIIQQLIDAGYTVVGLVMPGGTTTTGGTTASHASLNVTDFAKPIIATINTLAGSFSNIYMTGLSGGGWSTHMAAALDVRIKKSYPIAGSLPLYMPMTGAPGPRDHEQNLPGLTFSYLDLYALAALPAGRRQKQILHDGDTCCFSKSMYDEVGKPYASFLSSLVDSMGGDWDLVFKVLADHRFDTTIFNDEVLADI